MDADVAMVCRHVLDGAPILVAARDEDPVCEWRFLCGRIVEEDARAVPLDEVVRRDPSAVEIVMHPRGTTLERHDGAFRWRTGSGPVLFPQRRSRRYPRLEPRFAPRAGEALDAGDLRLLADVAQDGFHLASLAAEVARPAHAFSVGLFRSWDHPEIAILGLAEPDLREAVLRACERVRGGERFEHGGLADGLVDGRAVAFRRIAPRHCPAHLGHAVWYHGGTHFPALQAVWADPGGQFPWDRWCARETREAQPVLFESEPA